MPATAAPRTRRFQSVPARRSSITALSIAASGFVQSRTDKVIRPQFLDPALEAITAKHRAGWSAARITTWMRELFGGQPHPVATGWFINYVTELLEITARHALALAA
ncbi:MAG: hypothetical protein JWQ81_6503 [Amycolatopsis sp.]|jgi:hypothetical protein|uniref:hypothetical protein n=1 Tax=Amycolatopsis sp. TaxID=37632 RepID=UPI0026183654|nr:hypothetical protein [Amycolatopsis sp.]MCU1685764.1 hypothetical protein [Amycolatopsis sp.]